MTRAGEPAANTFGGMSRVTTEWAPITEPFPTVTPGMTATFRPSHTLFPMTVGPLYFTESGSTKCRSSSMIATNAAMSTLFPIRTSCHTSIDVPAMTKTSSPTERTASSATKKLTATIRPSASKRSPKMALPAILKITLPIRTGRFPKLSAPDSFDLIAPAIFRRAFPARLDNLLYLDMRGFYKNWTLRVASAASAASPACWRSW